MKLISSALIFPKEIKNHIWYLIIGLAGDCVTHCWTVFLESRQNKHQIAWPNEQCGSISATSRVTKKRVKQTYLEDPILTIWAQGDCQPEWHWHNTSQSKGCDISSSGRKRASKGLKHTMHSSGREARCIKIQRLDKAQQLPPNLVCWSLRVFPDVHMSRDLE